MSTSDVSIDYSEELKLIRRSLVKDHMQMINKEMKKIERELEDFDKYFSNGLGNAENGRWPWKFHKETLQVLAKKYGVTDIKCTGNDGVGYIITVGPKLSDSVVKVKTGAKKTVNHPAKRRRV